MYEKINKRKIISMAKQESIKTSDSEGSKTGWKDLVNEKFRLKTF